jgi:putative glycerol-1-phosphate prenyltransferase
MDLQVMAEKNRISKNFGKGRQLAVLIDPDNTSFEKTTQIIKESEQASIDYFFIGGSLLYNSLEDYIDLIKSNSGIPVILFPGNAMQISEKADAIMFISLISGRNPEYLIGHHVISAPFIRKSGIEVLPTGYILIENGRRTSVEYMSDTNPIPADKPEIVVATAMAGEMLGLKYTYLEAGSGASNHVGQRIIKEVRKNIESPLIVGGGIRSAEDASKIFNAGASLIVVGNAIESDISLIKAISSVR